MNIYEQLNNIDDAESLTDTTFDNSSIEEGLFTSGHYEKLEKLAEKFLDELKKSGFDPSEINAVNLTFKRILRKSLE